MGGRPKDAVSILSVYARAVSTGNKRRSRRTATAGKPGPASKQRPTVRREKKHTVGPGYLPQQGILLSVAHDVGQQDSGGAANS